MQPLYHVKTLQDLAIRDSAGNPATDPAGAPPDAPGRSSVVKKDTLLHVYAENVTAGGYVKGASGATICEFIREWSASGAVVHTASSCVTANGRWQTFSPFSYTTQQAGGSLEVYVRQGNPPSGSSFEVDGLVLSTP